LKLLLLIYKVLVVLNPIRAGMVEDAESWPWSSYQTMIGLEGAPPWLGTDWLLRHVNCHSIHKTVKTNAKVLPLDHRVYVLNPFL